MRRPTCVLASARNGPGPVGLAVVLAGDRVVGVIDMQTLEDCSRYFAETITAQGCVEQLTDQNLANKAYWFMVSPPEVSN